MNDSTSSLTPCLYAGFLFKHSCRYEDEPFVGLHPCSFQHDFVTYFMLINTNDVMIQRISYDRTQESLVTLRILPRYLSLRYAWLVTFIATMVANLRRHLYVSHRNRSTVQPSAEVSASLSVCAKPSCPQSRRSSAAHTGSGSLPVSRVIATQVRFDGATPPNAISLTSTGSSPQGGPGTLEPDRHSQPWYVISTGQYEQDAK